MFYLILKSLSFQFRNCLLSKQCVNVVEKRAVIPFQKPTAVLIDGFKT